MVRIFGFSFFWVRGLGSFCVSGEGSWELRVEFRGRIIERI